MAMDYKSPGVYVEEIAGAAPITGVGTSTAGFIGYSSITQSTDPSPPSSPAQPQQSPPKNSSSLPAKGGASDTKSGADPSPASAVEGKTIVAAKIADSPPAASETSTLAAIGEVKLCTNFTEFVKFFGDFSTQDTGHNLLAHAVFGFFRNGGTRCFVVRVDGDSQDNADVQQGLATFEAIDDIAIVAAPGITKKASANDIIDHCKAMKDRIAIIDTPEAVEDRSGNLDTQLLDSDQTANVLPDNSDYAALYFPWLQVFDPATKSNIYVPPSGHVAGVYARVDAQRGVFKAPANEALLGAIGLKYNISKNKQGDLNVQGVNCIRRLNGNIRIWGARTLGKTNGEYTYISVRRLMNYLKKSIDEGTQWAVFEPNAPDLWAKIRRSVTAFLLLTWRSGALFGTTPEQAFYVKCDAENNPPESRNQGQVVIEIGVAIVRPAEFVIFRLSQWTGPGGS